MSQEIDTLIAKKEAEFSALCSGMEACRRQFFKETAEYASAWFRKTAKDYIAKYSDVLLSLPEEKVVDLKREVNQLAENSQDVTRLEFDKPGLWWHLEPRVNDFSDKYRQVANRYPDVVDRAVRRVLGRLGLILEDYGFRVTARGITGTYYEFWFERPVPAGGAIPSYPHLLAWTENMQEAIREYNVYYVSARSLFNELTQLKQAKKQRQALTLWECF